MRRWVWLLVLFAVPALHGQVTNPGVKYVATAPSGACAQSPPIQIVISTGVMWGCVNGTWATIGGGGGGGTPGGSTTQGQFNNAGAFAGTSAETFRTADGSLSQLANVIYLSAGSDIGAQCTAAVTTLGATGGVIVFPNSTNIPMSTSCTGITQVDSFRAYGKLASIINCTFAGACFSVTQNPTTNGEIGGKFSGFEINGSDAAGQILIQCTGCSGWTWDDVQFQPYGAHTATNGAVCLEFDNTGTGTFIEGNTILPSVYFERACGPSVYLHDASADTSFAYNHFWLHLVSEGTNYGVIVDGGARVYGGFMEIFGNHVGPNGGILEFNGTSGTGGTGSFPTSAFINIMAEESGTGAGVVLNANTSGVINFKGAILNGPGGAGAMATKIGGSGAANVAISDSTALQGINSASFLGPLATDLDNSSFAGNIVRFENCPNLTSGQACVIEIGSNINTSGNQAVLGFENSSSGNFGYLGMANGAAVAWNSSGQLFGPSNILHVTGTLSLDPTSLVSGQLNLVPFGSSFPTYSLLSSNGGNILEFQQTGPGVGASAIPFIVYGAPFAGNNAATGTDIPANAVYQWSSTNAGFTVDTGVSRTGAGAVAIGNGAQGDFTGTLKLGTINAVTAIQANGTPGVTKTCVSAIVVVNGIITSCT